MPSPDEIPPLVRIRRALALAVERRSLRRTAREVGMSPSGLRKFLDGSDPYLPTRRKLESWYLKEGGGSYGSAATAAAARSAMNVLLRDLPPDRRPAARRAMVDLLEDHLAASETEPPPWLDSLREPEEGG